MKRLLALLFLLSASCVFAISTNERVTLTITVTEMAETGDSWTFQGYLRNWTNASSSSEILTNLSTSGTAGATTNLANNIAEFPYAGGPWLFRWSASNIVQIVGPLGTAIAASQIGDWCTFGLSTQKIAITKTMLYPLNGLIQSNAIDQASEIVNGVNTYSTNAFATNATAMRNYLRRTNDTGSNWIVHTLTTTNAVNYGNAFRSPGGGTGSEQIGSGASASTNYATAIGFAAQATNLYATAIGAYSIAQSNSAVALGYAATVQNENSIAIGAGTAASGLRSIAIGSGSEATHMDAIAFGIGITTSRSNSIVVGGTQDVIVGGRLDVVGEFTNNSVNITGGTITNASGAFIAATITNAQNLGGYDTNRAYDKGFATNFTLVGANTVAAGANVALPAAALTSVADGHNVLEVGSNAYVRLTGSATAAWQLGGMLGDIRNGRTLLLENATGYGMTVLNESGTTPTVGQRISCGSSFSIGNGGFVQFIYDSTATRWKVSTSRDTLGANGIVFVSVTTNYNGTNWGPLTTNIPAGYYPLGAFAQASCATSNSFVWSGATADYTNIFTSAPETRITTNAFTYTAGVFKNTYGGYYLVGAMVAGWPGVALNGNEIELEIFLEGVGQTHTEAHTTLVTGEKFSLSTSCLIYIPAGTSISARLRNESDVADPLPMLQMRLNIDSP